LFNISTPLPIELVLFTGHSEGLINKLIWETASEVNNDYFNLEKSADGFHFSSFDKINGAGNSTWTIDYSDYDYEPFDGITYYRLKQTDFNGDFSYSNTIALENVASTVQVDNLGPNPTNDFVNFDFTSSIKGNVHVQIIAYTGQVVIDKLQSVTEGHTKINTSVSDLAKGIYSVRVTFDQTGYSFTTLVVKD